MAYAELDKQYVRKYVGYGATWLQAEPRLENAILATQSVADGGGRPDSSTENYIKGLIYGTAAVTGNGVTPGGTAQNVTFAQPAIRGLLQIEAQIAFLDVQQGALQADEAKVDPARETARLRSEGQRLCHAMARMLGMRGVRSFYFYPGQAIDDDDPFSYSDLQHWRRGP